MLPVVVRSCFFMDRYCLTSIVYTQENDQDRGEGPDGMDSTYWEDLEPGDAAPESSFPISWRTLMIELVATGDFMPYHYHPTYAQSLGMRGTFVNTPFYLCLFSRNVTDWLGPDCDVRSAILQMLNQTVPGDVLRFSGRVTEKWEANGDCLVRLELALAHDLGVAATVNFVVAVPSRAHGRVQLRELPPMPEEILDPAMPDAARDLLGKKVVRQAPYPVSEAVIRHFAEMTRDENPLYADTDYARASRHGDMIAPLTGLTSLAVNAATQIGVDTDFPDPDLPDQPAWPFAIEKNQILNIRLPGTKDIIVQTTLQEYRIGWKRGDRVIETAQLINCSGQKQTRRGPGYFMKFLREFHNDKGELVGRATMTTLNY